MRSIGVFVTFLVARMPVTAAQPFSGTEDSRAEAQIRTRLRNDPDLKRDRIDVRVKNRVATLRGLVDSQSERAKADELAHVEGIERVRNELQGGRSEEAMQAVTDASISTKLTTQYAATRSQVAIARCSARTLTIPASRSAPTTTVRRRARRISITASLPVEPSRSQRPTAAIEQGSSYLDQRSYLNSWNRDLRRLTPSASNVTSSAPLARSAAPVKTVYPGLDFEPLVVDSPIPTVEERHHAARGARRTSVPTARLSGLPGVGSRIRSVPNSAIHRIAFWRR